MSELTFEVTGVEPTSVKLKDATSTFGIQDTATGSTAVTPTTAITPYYEDDDTLTYRYRYTLTLAAGTYLAVWEVVTSIGTSYTNQVFRVDSPVPASSGVTLQQIERALARRVGPFFGPWPVTGAASTTSVQLNRVKSRLASNQYDDLYLLRRGRYLNGTAVVGFDSDDRVRLVSDYDSTLGTLQPDRDWTTAPATNELIELHHLHPEDELRYCVQEGLKRCYFVEQAAVSLSSAAAERDLTSLLPWLQDASHVRVVETAYENQPTVSPAAVGWFKTVSSASGVSIRAANDPYPQTMQVTALRPADSYVNGATSVVGPNDDDDVLVIPLGYAVSSAHCAAWLNFPSRLAAAAAEGYQMTRQDASREFTTWGLKVLRQLPPEPIQAGNPFDLSPRGVQL